MAVPPADPLLRRPGPPGVGLQHFRTMIRLDDDDFAFADLFADILRRVAEIGQPRERAARREQVAILSAGETKSHRLLRIVRHREAFDLEVAKPKPRARL